MATEPTQTTPPAPQSSRPAVQPITQAELSAEINKAPEPTLTQTKTPPVEVRPVDPDAEERKSSLPDFKESLRKRVLGKKEDAPAEEPEKKAESAKEPVKVEAKPDPKEEEVPEDQRKILPHDKPETARRMKHFIRVADEAKKEAAAALARAEAAEKDKPTVANTEEVEKLRQEHTKLQEEALRLRRRYDIDNDPEFSAKYREPAKVAEATITDTLKRNGFVDGTLEAIKAEGGFSEFSRSRKTYPIVEKDPDDPSQTITVHKTGAEIARSWLNGLPVADSEAIRASIGRQQLLKSEESAAITKAQDEAKAYYDAQRAQQGQASAQQQEVQAKATKEYGDWLAKTEKETDFLKDREVPANADEAAKAQVEEYNTFNKQLRDSLKKHPTTALEYGQLKLDVAEAHHLRRVLGDKDAKIAALEAEIAKKKAAMRTTPRSGSLLKGDEPKPQKEEEVTDPMKSLRDRMRSKVLHVEEV